MKTFLENSYKADRNGKLPEVSDCGVTINGRYISYEELADIILRKCLTIDTSAVIAPTRNNRYNHLTQGNER